MVVNGACALFRSSSSSSQRHFRIPCIFICDSMRHSLSEYAFVCMVDASVHGNYSIQLHHKMCLHSFNKTAKKLVDDSAVEIGFGDQWTNEWSEQYYTCSRTHIIHARTNQIYIYIFFLLIFSCAVCFVCALLFASFGPRVHLIQWVLHWTTTVQCTEYMYRGRCLMFLRAKDMFTATTQIPVHSLWAAFPVTKHRLSIRIEWTKCGNKTNVTHYFGR